MGGYGHCGQELCCRRFNMSFDPVSIRMAKGEQDLPLNSTKISGACGRLMCCLRYEFEAYRDFKGAPPSATPSSTRPLGRGQDKSSTTRPRADLACASSGAERDSCGPGRHDGLRGCLQESKELGCACRPDTVTREVLDRLDSPGQMALAELDRKNGVAPSRPWTPRTSS